MSASPSPPAAAFAPTSKKPKSKKRKAESQDDAPTPAPAPTTTTTTQRKPKQKKRRKADAEDADSLLDLDRGLNLAVGRMDPQLLADHAAAQTRRFAPDLSPVELGDLYLPAGAILDTTAFAPEERTGEGLAGFLERFAGAGRVEGKAEEEERRRLGSAPKACGAPHTLIVAGAGLRAADLVR